MPHQHWIISSYIALGQPGGGGSLYPFAIFFTCYSVMELVALTCTDVTTCYRIFGLHYNPGVFIHMEVSQAYTS